MKSIKRYLLFRGEEYEPSGGARDLVKDFSTINEAIDFYSKMDDKEYWAHIFDIQEFKIVKECYYSNINSIDKYKWCEVNS